MLSMRKVTRADPVATLKNDKDLKNKILSSIDNLIYLLSDLKTADFFLRQKKNRRMLFYCISKE